MTGMRIEVDLEALVHASWKNMPWWQRAIIWVMPVSRASVEADVVRRMREGK